MGTAASQCARTCCGCCFSDDKKKGAKGRASDASTARDDVDAWFEHDKLPLLSATHGDDDAALDDGFTVRKVVVMRSPRHAAPIEKASNRQSSSHRSDSSSPPKRGLRPIDDRRVASPSHSQSHAEHVDNSPNSSNDGSWELASPGRGGGNEHSSPMRSPRSHQSDSEERGDHERSPPTREVARSPTRPRDHSHHRSQRSASAASQDSSGVHEDDADALDSPRSPRSPGKQSSGSSSPTRKSRYGRKNYRADSSRKKTL